MTTLKKIFKTHIWNRSYSWSPYLTEFTITHCLSPRAVLCAAQIGELSGNVVGIRFLVVALISVSLPGIQCCSWFSTFKGRGSFSGFHWAFPSMIFLSPWIREQMWRFSQSLSISISICTVGMGSYHTVDSETPCAHCEADLS